MRWLPEYGVGIIAFGSLTYTGWGNTVSAAFDRLDRTGGLVVRRPVPSPALVAARDDVSRLVARVGRSARGHASPPRTCSWIDRRSAGARRSKTLTATAGQCAPADTFDVVENALRGSWTMACERGRLQVAITLAPTMPPKVQYLTVRPAPAQPAAPGPCAGF